MRFYKRVLLIFIIALRLNSVGAQNVEVSPEIITDRPDQTEAPSLVEKHFLQIETGFIYSKRESGNMVEKELVYNTTLVRYGLLDNLELRLGTDVVQNRREVEGAETYKSPTGFFPLLLGAKIGVSEERGAMPEIGFLGHLHLPFAASEEFQPESTGVDIRFAFGHTTSEKSNLSYNLGAQWLSDASEVSYIYTLAYGYSLTSRLGMYAELYGDLPEESKSQHHWDAGLTFLVANNFQLDAFVGTGINNPQQLWTGGGLSYRFPN